MFAAVFSPISSNRPLSRPLCSLSPLPSNGRSLPNLPLGSRVFVRIKLAKHEETKKSKGHAFIQYSSQDDAVLAIEQMDQRRVNGRIIHAEMAKPLKNGFGDYPITSGPPSQPNSGTITWKDDWDGEEYY